MRRGEAETRILLAERSLRVFVVGIVSLVPVAGLPLAPIALITGVKTCLAGRGRWNPGRRHVRIGICLAGLSLLAQPGMILYLILKVMG